MIPHVEASSKVSTPQNYENQRETTQANCQYNALIIREFVGSLGSANNSRIELKPQRVGFRVAHRPSRDIVRCGKRLRGNDG